MKQVTLIRAFAVWIVAGTLTFGIVLAVLLPSPGDALAHAEDLPCRKALIWTLPTEDGSEGPTIRTELGITHEDFEESMMRDVVRSGTKLCPSPIGLVDPDDRYVREVARVITELTDGYSEGMRATAALWFVRTAIIYFHDSYTYGTHEFWAAPLETLYLGKGDCEDTAVLLMSILLAMDYDAVLLDYDGHEAVGVMIGGEMRYCETAGGNTSTPYSMSSHKGAEIYREGAGGAGAWIYERIVTIENAVRRLL